MKLIIDIPEDALKEMRTEEFISIESLDTAIECIKNGTPLDDVKAEIANINTFERAGCWVMEDVFKVLDNIGKTESEDT